MPVLRNIWPALLSALKGMGEKNFLLLLAGLTGLFSGVAAVLLKTSVHFIHEFLYSSLQGGQGSYFYLYYACPLIGVLGTVLLAKYVLKEKFRHGITQILYAVSKNFSIVRRKRSYSLLLGSTFTVGFGGSVGLEAPIVVTGSAIASSIGRLAHIGYRMRTILIGCGAAGAISGIFNSPIAGAVFALEVILTEVSILQFTPVLIASVVGAIISQVLTGQDILFSFQLKDPFLTQDIPYYMLLGILCGFISLYFMRMSMYIESRVEKIGHDTSRAFVGGAALMLLIWAFPPLYGEGYGVIKYLLNGEEHLLLQKGIYHGLPTSLFVLLPFLILVMLAKPVAAAATTAGGGCGGVFAPSLYTGAICGYLFASMLNLVPFVSVSTSNFTLVGMSGLMSGILHAPLTAIFLIAEITGGYTLFIPLIIVSSISYLTIHYFEKHSFYTKHLAERGDWSPENKDKRILGQMNIQQVLEKDLLTVSPEASIEDLVSLVQRSKRNVFPVVTGEGKKLEGIVTLDNIREIMFDAAQRKNTHVRDLMQEIPESLSLHESMNSVMNKFESTQAWSLPVIEQGSYVGFVSKASIFSTYRKKLNE